MSTNSRPARPRVAGTSATPGRSAFLAERRRLAAAAEQPPVPADRLQRRSLPPALRQMDPRLQRARARQAAGTRRAASASTRKDEIAVLAKVTDLAAWNDLSEVREGVLLGDPAADGSSIVTARIPLSRVEHVRHQPFVTSLKAAQPVHRTLVRTVQETLSGPADLGLPATGKDVVVGVVDFGGDFAHLNFRDGAGKTRLLALWDQGATPAGGSNTVGYGALHRPAAINAALKKADPYLALGYDVDEEAHGTHVMDIAAGNGLGTGVPGMAPQAELVFVELGSSDIPWFGPEAAAASFGDSVQLLEAVEFIFREAGERPCVVNLSLGTNGGPHDGTTLAEEGMDRLVRAKGNRALVIAASNSQDDGIHAAGTVPANGSIDLQVDVPFRWNQEHEVELWYPGASRIQVELIAPDGTSMGIVAPGDTVEYDDDAGGGVAALLANRLKDPNNGDNVINLWLDGRVPRGRWTLKLSSAAATDFHAWIERNDEAQASFATFRQDTHCLGSISCGQESIVVGSYDAHKASVPVSYFSSAGPTRAGVRKPEVCAPGHAVVAALSRSGNGAVEMSGTSMAAPAVTGLVALLLSVAAQRKQKMSSTAIRNVVLSTARGTGPAGSWDAFRGYGRVCGRDALKALGPAKITVKARPPKIAVKPGATGRGAPARAPLGSRRTGNGGSRPRP